MQSLCTIMLIMSSKDVWKEFCILYINWINIIINVLLAVIHVLYTIFMPRVFIFNFATQLWDGQLFVSALYIHMVCISTKKMCSLQLCLALLYVHMCINKRLIFYSACKHSLEHQLTVLCLHASNKLLFPSMSIETLISSFDWPLTLLEKEMWDISLKLCLISKLFLNYEKKTSRGYTNMSHCWCLSPVSDRKGSSRSITFRRIERRAGQTTWKHCASGHRQLRGIKSPLKCHKKESQKPQLESFPWSWPVKGCHPLMSTLSIIGE